MKRDKSVQKETMPVESEPHPNDAEDRLISMKEALAILGMSRQTWYRNAMYNEPELVPVKFGRRGRHSWRGVLAYMERRRQEAMSEAKDRAEQK